MTERHHITPAGRVAGVTVAVIFVVFACFIVGRVAGQNAAESAAQKVNDDSIQRSIEKQREFVESCNRGNIARGQQLRDDLEAGRPEDYRRDRHIAPILDCEATIANGNRAVPLTPRQQRMYVDGIADGRVPVILRGGVVR